MLFLDGDCSSYVKEVSVKPSDGSPFVLLCRGVAVKKAVDDLSALRCGVCGWTVRETEEFVKHGGMHGGSFCVLCLENSSAFPSELGVVKDIHLHNYENHKECIFCKRSFFDSAAIFRHCVDSHEQCSLCQVRHVFFEGLNDLRRHWDLAHYTCTFLECRRNKIYVFGSWGELLSHSVLVHGVHLDVSTARRSSDVVQSMRVELEIGAVDNASVAASNDQVQERQSNLFPSFNQKANMIQEDQTAFTDEECSTTQGDIPLFLNRNIIKNEKIRDDMRNNKIRKKFPDKATKIIEIMQNTGGDIELLINNIEEFMRPSEVYVLISEVIQINNERILKEYKKKVMFPGFRKAPTRNRNPDKRNDTQYRRKYGVYKL